MNNPCSYRVVCYSSVEGSVNGIVNGFFVGYLNASFNGTINGGFFGTIDGDFNGTINGNFTGTINGDFNGTINGDFNGTINGNFNGTITGNFNGTITGELCGGTINGDFNGTLVGTFTGTIGGVFQTGAINQAVNAEIIGEFCGTIDGTFDGEIDGGTFIGELNGTLDGNLVGTFNGSWNGTFNGNFNGAFTGDLSGTFSGNFNGTFNGDLNGYFNGNLNGDLNGTWNGQFNGTNNGIPTDPDFPWINYTTEPPEEERDPTILFPPPGFPPNTPPDICIPTTGQTCPEYGGGGSGGGSGGTTPPPIIVYNNSPQTCSRVCAPGTVTYTTPAGIRTGPTQAAADAAAYDFACDMVDIICAGGDVPPLLYNTQQTCNNDCGSSYTVPAGTIADITVEAANIIAQTMACNMALIQCPVNPILPEEELPSGGGFPDNGGGGSGGSGGGSGGGGGFSIPPSNTQPDVSYTNSVQTCVSVCQNGGSFTSSVASGQYFGASPEIANSVAYSVACNNAQANKFCLSQVQVSYCKDVAMSLTMSIGGVVVPVNWQVTGLPTGLSMTDLGTDGATMLISGTPTVTGSFDATFTITDPATGNYLVATRTFNIQEITSSAALPEATLDEPYSTFIEVDGFVATVEWIVTAGALPAGLTLNPNTGEISGTPTAEETAIFTVGVSGGDGSQCTKEFTLPVAGEESEWDLTWGTPDIATNCTFAHLGGADNISTQSTTTGVAIFPGAVPPSPGWPFAQNWAQIEATQTYAGAGFTGAIEATGINMTNRFGVLVKVFFNAVEIFSQVYIGATPGGNWNDSYPVTIPGPGNIRVTALFYDSWGDANPTAADIDILFT